MQQVKDRAAVEVVAIEPRDARELAIARLIDAPADKLFRCWTDPALIPEWFCPKPWVAEVLSMDVRPGGTQSLVMRGPDGASHPSGGVYLEIVPGRKLVFTSAMGEGWRPVEGDLQFVGEVSFEPQADGRTLYVARAMHWSEATARAHQEMGFEGGWGIAAEQMAELARRL